MGRLARVSGADHRRLRARAFAADWRPIYDSAYFTARAADVFTSHHPFVGSWSTFGAVLQEPIHNLGPLQVLVMAPFTQLQPYIGSALGVAFVNVLAVVAVWLTSRRLFGLRGVIAVMAATAVLMVSFGGPALIDARQQHALLLPFWALLWLTADLMRGSDRALLPWVAAGSFVVQTQLSFAYLVFVIALAGIGGYVWSNRLRYSESTFRRYAALGVVLGMALWGHTIWDEFFGDGNLGTVLRHAGGDQSAGWSAGTRIVADSSFGYPWWWPGSVRDFRDPWTFGIAVSMVTVLAWMVALGVKAFVGIRRADRRTVNLAALSLALVVTALITAARIPPSNLDSLSQTYFWLWPLSLFAAMVLIAGAAPAVPRTENVAEAAAVFTTLVALLAVPNRFVFPPRQVSEELMDAGAGRCLAVSATRSTTSHLTLVPPLLSTTWRSGSSSPTTTTFSASSSATASTCTSRPLPRTSSVSALNGASPGTSGGASGSSSGGTGRYSTGSTSCLPMWSERSATSHASSTS